MQRLIEGVSFDKDSDQFRFDFSSDNLEDFVLHSRKQGEVTMRNWNKHCRSQKKEVTVSELRELLNDYAEDAKVEIDCANNNGTVWTTLKVYGDNLFCDKILLGCVE